MTYHTQVFQIGNAGLTFKNKSIEKIKNYVFYDICHEKL